MNYLAHALLSPADDTIMVGNLVGDYVRSLEDIHPGIREGVILHRRIDSVANSHPAFRRSTRLLTPTLGHYARAVLDIFYDHLLARHFTDFVPATTLDGFVESTDRRFQGQRHHLPPDIATRWDRLTWLTTYAHHDGIASSLRRLSQRSRRNADLTTALPLLDEFHDALKIDLEELLPDLQTLV
jgi:acyl carrier protein phosphodiesterase